MKLSLPGSFFLIILVFCCATAPAARAATEELDWKPKNPGNITCIYGTITVLATNAPIYFCGANWSGVEGYCGIQNLSATDRRTIFSIWDTTSNLHPVVTAADSQTVFSHFTGEGEGGHSHMPLDWKVGETFHFFIQKRPGSNNTTDNCFYMIDHTIHAWRHIVTIHSPNGADHQGATFDGVLSWIENIGGQADVATPKVALYDLWVGSSPDTLSRITTTGGESGSGRWGKLGDAYFLAEGSPHNLDTFFAAHESSYGKPTFGSDGQELPPLHDKQLSANLIQELKNLPGAPAVPVK